MIYAARATILGLAAAGLMALISPAPADAASVVRVHTATSTDLSAQSRRRPRVRIYRSIDTRGVYPSYFPGPNAVRDCSVAYVQEFRPSGTIIAPHMRCFWRQP